LTATETDHYSYGMSLAQGQRERASDQTHTKDDDFFQSDKCSEFYSTVPRVFQKIRNRLFHVHAAIHMQRDTGDVSRARARQERHGGGDIFGLSQTFQRHMLN
jgi:hypothetical protein